MTNEIEMPEFTQMIYRGRPYNPDYIGFTENEPRMLSAGKNQVYFFIELSV